MTDRNIYIATAPTRTTSKWRNKQTTWLELLDKCSRTLKTNETLAEFNAMPKDEQSNIKDVGGFVGGYLTNGRRSKGHVKFRDILTLDIDYGVTNFWDGYQMAFDCASFVYSTHKHTPEKPRIRLVILLSRSVTPEEYEAVGRSIAARVGIELFDDTTYESERLMYWPSTPRDMEFYFESQDGPALDPEEMLATYQDWHDVSEWAYSKRVVEKVRHEITKQGEPTTKPGIVGAFCRCYDIDSAIAEFLSDVYASAGNNRYTYIPGSVAAGLVIYENGAFAYSHNNTDPCSLNLVNAFDLVRLHRYADLDENCDTKTAINNRPSYKAMAEFASRNPEVKKSLTDERLKTAYTDFSDLDFDEAEEVDDDDWKEKLTTNSKGKIDNTIANATLIIANVPGLKGKIWHDDFSGRECVNVGRLPWREVTESNRYWNNADYACLRKFLEAFGISGKDKISDALVCVSMQHHKHPVVEYLRSLTWDGVSRLDTLLIDFLGCSDDELTRCFTRKQFIAAVARVMQPGYKHDNRLVIFGTEGLGKSLLLQRMGMQWHNDSLPSITGKEGMEELRGSWIIEMAELASTKKSELEEEKKFLSKQFDEFRPAYGQVKEVYPRQCVFFGTTNEKYFLKGDTGNRRQWVVEGNVAKRKYKVWEDLTPDYRDQVWAEALRYYDNGESTYLSPEQEQMSKAQQIAHNEVTGDERFAIVQHYLDVLLPLDWSTWSVERRKAYFRDTDPLSAEGTAQRDYISAMEIYVECFGGRIEERRTYEMKSINFMMSNMPGWEKSGRTMRLGPYGTQRVYERINKSFNTDEEL